MSDEQVSIRTQDGECPAYVFTPSASDQHPAVTFYMDGLGIRPTILRWAGLADPGYVVLVPDLFYRAGPYEALDPKKVFASGDVIWRLVTCSPRPTIAGRARTRRRSWPT